MIACWIEARTFNDVCLLMPTATYNYADPTNFVLQTKNSDTTLFATTKRGRKGPESQIHSENKQLLIWRCPHIIVVLLLYKHR